MEHHTLTNMVTVLVNGTAFNIYFYSLTHFYIFMMKKTCVSVCVCVNISKIYDIQTA